MKSIRRDILDKLLIKHQNVIKGRVLDIGGRKVGKRGNFRINHKKIQTVKYLNIDKKTKPDYLSRAEKIPVKNKSFDTIILTEVLEYIDDIDIVLAEVKRVSKKDASIICSVPFLVPVHGDFLIDKKRYTIEYLKKKFKKHKLRIKKIEYMGSAFAVIYDILKILFGYSSKKNNFISSRILRVFKFIFVFFDGFFIVNRKFITTGYFFILKN